MNCEASFDRFLRNSGYLSSAIFTEILSTNYLEGFADARKNELYSGVAITTMEGVDDLIGEWVASWQVNLVQIFILQRFSSDPST
jgi:hypothetical protein